TVGFADAASAAMRGCQPAGQLPGLYGNALIYWGLAWLRGRDPFGLGLAKAKQVQGSERAAAVPDTAACTPATSAGRTAHGTRRLARAPACPPDAGLDQDCLLLPAGFSSGSGLASAGAAASLPRCRSAACCRASRVCTMSILFSRI